METETPWHRVCSSLVFHWTASLISLSWGLETDTKRFVMGGRSGSRASVNRTRTTPCSPPTGPSCSPPAHHLWAYHCTPPLHPRSTYHPSVPAHGHLRGPAHYPSPPEIPRESPVNTSHLIQQPCQAFELPCSGRCLRCGGRRVRRLRLSDQRLTHQADDQPVALDGAHALLQLEQDGVLVLDVAALRLSVRWRCTTQGPGR